MVIRELRYDDIKEIDDLYKRFYQQDFYLPSLANTITHAVVEDDSGILGFGEVKIFAEAIMVLDMNAKASKRALAMRALMFKAIEDCKNSGVEQLHTSVLNGEFAGILRKHYEFENVKGIILARKIKEL